MNFLPLSFLAGILTVLSPCVLPLLPIVVGGSLSKEDKFRPYVIAGSLALSVTVFTLLLKASTVLIGVHPRVWSVASGVLVVGLGLFILFPDGYKWLTAKLGVSAATNTWLAKSGGKNSRVGAVLTGASLGPVFSSCSPTYALILATILPQSLFVGTLNILAYAIGLAFVLLLIGVFGQRLVAKLRFAADPNGWFQRTLGVLFVIVGIGVITGYDKQLEAWLLENTNFNATLLEADLFNLE